MGCAIRYLIVIGAIVSLGLAHVFLWSPGETIPVTNMLGVAALIFTAGGVVAGVAWLCWRYKWMFWLTTALVAWGCVSFYNARFANCGNDGAWWGPCQHTSSLNAPAHDDLPPGFELEHPQQHAAAPQQQSVR
jgi:hypothetical protein